MQTPIAQPTGGTPPVPPGSTPQIEAEIAANIQRQQVADAAGRRAATTAMPGPTAEAFLLPADILVGPYKVRPFFDGDFETLSMLGHPLHQMMTESLEGKPPTANLGFMPRGPQMWELCYILTHTTDEVDALMVQGPPPSITEENGKPKLLPGYDALRKAAKAEFAYKVQFPALQAMTAAIVQQLTRYWNMVQGYKAADAEGEGKKSSPPPPSGEK